MAPGRRAARRRSARRRPSPRSRPDTRRTSAHSWHEPALGAVAPDLRDVSRPDPTEAADPDVRRRVPHLDASTASFDRARRLLDDVVIRREAEHAAAAHAAELEPEDDQLRAELARQAALDDEHGDTDGAYRHQASDHGEALDRTR